jgi:cell division protein FtsI (penicillin-binding protein 3)
MRVVYQASFVGYFPADNPRYSCIVVVNAPSNDLYYAAQVAGPIFKEIADKVYSSRLEMHRELGPEQADSSDIIPPSVPGYQPDLKTVYAALGISPSLSDSSAEWVVPLRQKKGVVLSKRRFHEALVPNVTGMSLKDAIYILENAGLHVKIAGRGYVRHQSVSPGTRIIKGMEIKIQLS